MDKFAGAHGSGQNAPAADQASGGPRSGGGRHWIPARGAPLTGFVFNTVQQEDDYKLAIHAAVVERKRKRKTQLVDADGADPDTRTTSQSRSVVLAQRQALREETPKLPKGHTLRVASSGATEFELEHTCKCGRPRATTTYEVLPDGKFQELGSRVGTGWVYTTSSGTPVTCCPDGARDMAKEMLEVIPPSVLFTTPTTDKHFTALFAAHELIKEFPIGDWLLRRVFFDCIRAEPGAAVTASAQYALGLGGRCRLDVPPSYTKRRFNDRLATEIDCKAAAAIDSKRRRPAEFEVDCKAAAAKRGKWRV
jgi:hypothetical protein